MDQHAQTTWTKLGAGVLRVALAGTVLALVVATQSLSGAPGAYLAAGLALIFGGLIAFGPPGFLRREVLIPPLVDSVLLFVLATSIEARDFLFLPLYLLATLEVFRATAPARIAAATAALAGSYLAAVAVDAGSLRVLDPLLVAPGVVLVALFCLVAGTLGARVRALQERSFDLSANLAIEQDRVKKAESLVSELGPALGTLNTEGILRWTAEAARVVSAGSYVHVAALDGGQRHTILDGDPEVCPSWWHPAIQRFVLWGCLEGDTVRSEESVHGIEGFMAVPVGVEEGEKWGAIVVGGKKFYTEDERVLKLLSATVARVLQEAEDSPGGLDQASGLPNRASLYRVLRQALSRGRALTVLVVGVEGLRRYGRRRGLDSEDALVRRLAERLKGDQRLAFRYGEETFAVVMAGTAEARARGAVTTIEHGISQEARACSFPLTTSVGVAFAEAGEEDAESVLETAMHALNTAGGQTRIFTGYNAGAPASPLQGDLRISGVVQAFVETLETRDPLISDHLRAVSDLSRRIGSKLSLSPDQLDILALGALLHDVGKIGVPDHILQKPTRLTEEEYEIMRRHPALGARMLAPIRELSPALAVVKYHHERFDGEGYPDGLRGGNIPIAARIVSAADAFDAMMRDRPYGYGISLEAASEEIIRGSGNRFDPEVVQALLETQEEDRRSSSVG